MKSFEPRETVRNCAKCGDHRTRVIGQKKSPMAIDVRCNTCGHVFSVSTGGSASDGHKEQA